MDTTKLRAHLVESENFSADDLDGAFATRLEEIKNSDVNYFLDNDSSYLNCEKAGEVEFRFFGMFNYLWQISVEKKHYRQGIGLALMKEAANNFGGFVISASTKSSREEFYLTDLGAILISSCLEKGIVQRYQIKTETSPLHRRVINAWENTKDYVPTKLLDWSNAINPNHVKGQERTDGFFEGLCLAAAPEQEEQIKVWLEEDKGLVSYQLSA